MLWLPQKRVVISGDTAFHERLLPVFQETQTSESIKTWDSFEALGAKIVIPGHGGPTNMAEVTNYTKEYLVYMRNEIGAIIDNGGGLVDAYKVDQSAYEHLDTFEFLALRNAARIFQAMELE
jgi:glyoxylase-like metal-dependent hydrolase (beta-lactamase superfamily II)